MGHSATRGETYVGPAPPLAITRTHRSTGVDRGVVFRGAKGFPRSPMRGWVSRGAYASLCVRHESAIWAPNLLDPGPTVGAIIAEWKMAWPFLN